MNNVFKRSVSMLLALLMILGNVPVNALAMEQETEPVEIQVVETTEYIPASESEAVETTCTAEETQTPEQTEAPAEEETVSDELIVFDEEIVLEEPEFEEADVPAAGETWYWEDDTLYIQDGKITKAQLYAALDEKYDEKGKGKFKYMDSEPWNWDLSGTEVTASAAGDADLTEGTWYVRNQGSKTIFGSTTWSYTSGTTETFTVRHYYVVTTAVAEGSPAGADISVASNHVVKGDTVQVTVSNVEGYTASVTDSKGNVVTNLDAYAPTESTTLTVSYISNAAAKYAVALEVLGGNYGTAALKSDDELTEGAEALVEVIVNSGDANHKYELVSVKAGQTDLTKNDNGYYVYTMGAADVTITVTFCAVTLEKNASVGTVGFNPKKAVNAQLDKLQQDIFAAVVNSGASLPEGISVEDVTIQYFPWYKGNISGGYQTDADKVTALNEAPPSKTLYTGYSFGELFAEGTKTTETVRLTGKNDWAGLSLEAEITLEDNRPFAQIFYTDPGVTFETLADIDAAVMAALSAEGTGTVTAVMAEGQTLPTGGQSAVLTYNVTVAEDENYKGNTTTVTVTATAKANPAAITIEAGTGSVIFGGLTASGSLAAGTYTLTVTPADLDSTDGSVQYVEEVLVNGEAVSGSITEGVFTASVTVENNTAYTVTAIYGTHTLDAKDGTVYINGNLTNALDKLNGLKGKVLTVAGLSAEGNYTVFMVTGTGTYDVETGSYLEKAAMIALLNVGDTQGFVIRDEATGVSKTVKMTVADSRKTVTIETEDLTVEAKAEPADLMEQLKAKITAVATDPVTGATEPVEGTVSFQPEYAWPADGERAEFTVTVSVSENADYVNNASATLKLTCVDTTVLYTVTYLDGYTQEKVAEYVIAENLATQTPDDPTREYYTFVAWTPAVADTVTESVTYTATWTPVQDVNSNGIADQEETFTVIYTDGVADEEIFADSKTEGLVCGDATPAAPTGFTREGWNFKGWDVNPIPETVSTPASGNTITYTAQWSKMWVVEFNGHTYKDFAEIENGQTVAKPTDEWDDGHDFLGWYNGDAEYDFTAPVTGNLNLTAKWREDYNNNDVEDTTEEHYTVFYVVDGQTTEYSNVLVNMPTPAYGSDPVKEGYVFNGWTPALEENVTGDVTYTAQWLADSNGNGKDDAEETMTVTILGTGSVNGNAESFTLVYDSTKDQTVALKAEPVMENGASKTYVSSVSVFGEEAELTYTDYAVELNVAPRKDEVVVTFTDCGYTYDEDGMLRFYQGMEDPEYDALYKAVIAAPEYDAAHVESVKYLARPAGTYEYRIPEIITIDLGFGNPIKLGGEDRTVDLPDAWLDIADYKELVAGGQLITKDELDAQLQQGIDAIKAEIEGLSLTELWNKRNEISAAINNLSSIVTEKAAYLGYHQFGAGENKDEEGNVQEILQVIYDNGAMRLVDEEIFITLTDDRAPTVLTGGNLTFEYDEYTNADLLAAISVATESGEAVEGEVSILVDMSGKNVGEYTYTAYYGGSWDYKPASQEFTLTVVKAPSSMDVPNLIVTHGEEYDANPVITNKHGKVITIDAVRFVVGMNVAELDIDGDGIHGITGQIQLMLPEGNILNTVLGNKEYTLSELMEVLKNSGGLLENFGVTPEIVDALNSALESISGIAENGELKIIIGGSYPTDVGAYLNGAVSTDGNYETSFDVGYLVIKPDAQQVWLDWNYTDSNGIFTAELLKTVDMGASAFDDEAFAVKNDEATALVQNLFFGIDANRELVAHLYGREADSETMKRDLGNGAYTQLAFIADFGNELYYAVPVIRAFAMVPSVVNVDVIVDGAESADLYTAEFDNAPVEVTANLTGPDLDSTYEVTYHYYGIEGNTAAYDSTVAPTHTGAYLIAATAMGKNAEGVVTAVGMDAATLVIKPTESAVTMKEMETVKFNGAPIVVSETMEIAVSSKAGGLKPDTTVITGGLSPDETYNRINWKAVNGTANVDFPAWVEALIARYAPSVRDGITVSQLQDKLMNKLPDIADKLAELGLTDEMVNYAQDLLGNVCKVLEQMPDDVVLSFVDNYAINNAGVYAVMAVVTDSDHIPSSDAGLLVVEQKEMTAADVKLDGALTYNGTEQTQGIAVTEGITYEVTGNTGTNAGEYTLTVVATGNYTGTVELAWSIAKATASVKVNDTTKVYGDADPEFTTETKGLMSKDQLNVTLTRAKGETVGEYIIEAAASDDNYNILFVPGKLTITKAPVTVTVVDVTKVVGEADPEFTAEVEGLKFSDALELTFTREAGEEAGEYAIEASASNDNYDITFVPGKLTIATHIDVALEQAYIALQPDGTYELKVNVYPESLTDKVVWDEETEKGIISVDDNGKVTAHTVGTDYVLVTLTNGGYSVNARCRVDVYPAEVEISGAQLATRKLTTELYSRNYAELDVVLLLKQNDPKLSASNHNAQSEDEKQHASIVSAKFTDAKVDALFELQARDDRTLLVIPRMDTAVKNPTAVRSIYSSAITLEVTGAGRNFEITTAEKVTMTVRKTLPKLRAAIGAFNSFYSGQSQQITFTGGTVTSIYEDASKNTARTTAIPSWLTLSNGTMTLTKDAPAKTASGRAYLLVDTEEWAIPAKVTLSVKNNYRTPGLRLSASSVNTLSDVNASGGIKLTLAAISRKDTLAKLNVTDITASEADGYKVTGFDTETGSFLLNTKEGFRTGEIYLTVHFSDTDKTMQLPLKVKTVKPALRLSASSVTLNENVKDTVEVRITATPADYILDAKVVKMTDSKNVEITGSDELAYEIVNGVLTVSTTETTKAGTTYKLYIQSGDSKAVVLNVKTVSKTPTVTFRTVGSLDLSFPDNTVTVIPSFRDYSGSYILSGEDAEFELLNAETEQFELKQDGKNIIVRCKAGVSAGNYPVDLQLKLADGTELNGTVQLKVKQTPVKLKLSATSVNLNKTVNDKTSVAVTCATKGYAFTQPVWELMDGKDILPEDQNKLSVRYTEDGKLHISLLEGAEPGKSYKVLLRAHEGAPAATLTVRVLAKNAEIKASLRVSGSLDVIRDATRITVTPRYTNVLNGEIQREVLKIYSVNGRVNTFVAEVEADNGVFVIDNKIIKDHTVRYRVQLETTFKGMEEVVKSSMTAITVKMGGARFTLKAEGDKLYARDMHSRINFTLPVNDASLNSLCGVEIKQSRYSDLFEIHNYGNGNYAIGFKEGADYQSIVGRTVFVTLNLFVEGNTTENANKTVNVRIQIVR